MITNDCQHLIEITVNDEIPHALFEVPNNPKFPIKNELEIDDDGENAFTVCPICGEYIGFRL